MYNTINSLVSQAIEPQDNYAMSSGHGFSDAEIAQFVQANIGNPQAIANAAQQYGITPAEISRATGYSTQQIGDYFANAGINFGTTPAQAMAQPVSAPTTQGVSNQQIVDYLNANPNITGKQLESVMQQYGVSPNQIASALSENAQQGGYQTQTLVNPESGQMNIDARNLGAGFNAYQDENGQTSGFSRVDPSRPGMIQLYGPNGEYRGEEKITSTTQDLIKNLGPIALAAGGSALAQGLLGGTSLGALGETGVGSAFELANAGAGAFGGGAATGAATTIAGTGMTLAELAQLDLALGGAGGTARALEMASTIGGATGAAAAADAISGMGAGTGLTTTGNTALSSMGGGTGLLPSTAANLEAMGGAQGLTTAAAGGGILGATGLNTGLGVGAGLGSTLAGLDTGVSSLTGGTDVTGMGGGTGITANNTGLGLVPSDAANLETMGGGQGLTTAGAGGGILGETGLNTGLGVLGGTGLGTTLAGLNTGVTGGLTGAGSTLAGTAAGAAGGLGGGLGSTLAGLDTGVGAGLGAAAGGAAAGGLGSALGTSLGTGLGLSALGTGLSALANQQGISQARDLINQYGTRASEQLANAYANAQGLNTANRTDLGNLYANTSGNLQNLYNQQVGYQAPYQDVGRSASQGLIANQPYFTHQFNADDLAAGLAPNYNFMLQQGQMANQRAANAGGGALGGNALQGLQRYTQDYAGNAYQNAFNNYNTQRNNIYNTLAGMAGIGQTSTGQLTNLGTNYGSNMAGLSSNYGGNLTTNAGQGIGAANAYGLNQANLATGIGSALATNATQQGADNASLLSNLGNTALLGSMIKAT